MPGDQATNQARRRAAVSISIRIFSGVAFKPGDTQHAWSAVHIQGHWRLVDPTWGAGDYGTHASIEQHLLGDTDTETGEYCSNLNEHYFLTDPKEFSFSHFPSIENGEDCEKWQLIDNPISLDEFNSLPHLSSMFFELGLELVGEVPTPWVVQDGGVLRIKAWEAIQYKVRWMFSI